MKAIFNSLFSVDFLHDYFPGSAFDGLQIRPNGETRELFLKEWLFIQTI